MSVRSLFGVRFAEVGLCVLPALVGCAADPPPAARAPAPAPAPTATVTSGLDGGRSGEFRSKRFELLLTLPDGAAWRIDDHSGPWLSATHAGSASKLLVRTWLESDHVNRDRCEERARSWAKLPEREGAEILRRERIGIPPEFDTMLEIGIASPQTGSPLDAFAIAFGGWARRCFAYVYTTSASGPDAERLVGERLAAIVDGSLSKVELESDLAPRIPREPPLDRFQR